MGGFNRAMESFLKVFMEVPPEKSKGRMNEQGFNHSQGSSSMEVEGVMDKG